MGDYKKIIIILFSLAFMAVLAFSFKSTIGMNAGGGSVIIVEPTAETTPLTQSQIDALIKTQLDNAKGKLKPQMGWSSWNAYHQNINEKLIIDIAHGMKDTGLVSAGYKYLNLDDCWQASVRNKNGNLQFDAGVFPSKEGLVQKVNSLGLKLGIYSSAGVLTCEDMPGSLFFERQDARLFAQWGVEYLKYDYCHVVDIPTDPNSGNLWPTQTPDIYYLGITPLDEIANEVRYPAAQAKLSGSAALSNGVVTGLCNKGGTAAFKISAPKAGSYALAVGYDGAAFNTQRFAQAEIDGKACEIWFPPSENQTGTIKRVDIEIQLKKGENTITLSNPIDGQKADSILRYRRMGDALIDAVRETPGAKPIFYSICEHGRTDPWEWAPDFASSWRTAGDIRDNWKSVKDAYEKGNSLWEYQRPGAYNDPDMLEVGVGNLNKEQNRSHFTLWSMMSAPLILACDTSKFKSDTSADGIDRDANNGAYDIITNKEVIALNQDDAMLQAKRISTKGGVDVLVKPLANGEAAICFFNKTGRSTKSASIDLSKLSSFDERVALASTDEYMVMNLWDSQVQYTKMGNILDSGELPRDGVAVFRVRAVR